jgi:hypothetical protein
MSDNFYLPYLLNYASPVAEDVVIFVISALIAVLISAESQAFAATFLGDSRPGATDRFHFNAFLHLSVLGTVSFLVAGFGWAKVIDIDQTKFKKHPRLFLIISRLAGPAANLLMANIAASLSWIVGNFGFIDKVFATITVVNVTMAIYGLLPMPPLPGAALLFAFFPENDSFRRIREWLCKVGPYLIIAVFAFARWSGWDGISSVFNPLVLKVTEFLLNF